MNDGKAPKRSIFTYVFPYILMAAAAGLFIWLIVSNLFNRSNNITESALDETVLNYKYNETSKQYEIEEYGKYRK